MTELEKFHTLSFYTLALHDDEFIHQHVVDAYSAQTAGDSTKPVTLIFALAGLYLFIEKNFTGKEVQSAHMQMAKKTKQYIKISLPPHRGNITITEVLEISNDEERNIMIKKWCHSVWQAFLHEHERIIGYTNAILFPS